jgi:hypothetical protein
MEPDDSEVITRPPLGASCFITTTTRGATMPDYPLHNPSGLDPRDDIERAFRQAAMVVWVMNDPRLLDWQRRDQIERILGMSEVHPHVVNLIAGLGMQAVTLADRLRQYEPVYLINGVRIDLEEVPGGNQPG